MTLIDGDKTVTTQVYYDEHGKFIEEKMSIIEIINAYTTEGVTAADDVLDKIRAEIADLADSDAYGDYQQGFNFGLMRAAQIIDKYKEERSGEE